jgi:phosphatidylglycerol---prolipoprotein diacylglyceryl transferase
MYPKLFEIFGISVYSFGLMMGISFIVGSLILTSEMKRKNINIESSDAVIFFLRILYAAIVGFALVCYILSPGITQNIFDILFGSALHAVITAAFLIVGIFLFRKPSEGLFDLAGGVTILAVVYGVTGSKILYLIESWHQFLHNPFGEAFSPGGLTWYGGFVLVTGVIFWCSKKVNIKFWKIADAVAPALLLSYGIARIGCHLAGDGDYGFPTSLPWGTNYSKGTFPPSLAFRDFPEIASHYPGGVVPDNTPCHPTPIYELIMCSILFYFLWRYRKKIVADGRMFMWYLIAAGSERFLIEFIRLNPRILFGLSEAQLISIVLIACGLYGLKKIPASPPTPA